MGEYSSIALDSNGRPHISYHDTSNLDLKYAYWDGTQWQVETVDSDGKTGEWTSIAIDTNDHPHISYYDTYSGPPAVGEPVFATEDLMYAYWDGTQWQVATVDDEGTDSSGGDIVGKYTSIALDSTGRPHIAYYDGTNFDLKYAYWDGSSWQIETVDSDGKVGAFTSIAIDTNDLAHISYNDSMSGYLKYAKSVIEPPTGLVATPGNGKVTLSWNPVSDVTGYNIYRSTTSGSGFSKINTALVTETVYEDTSVANGITYYYHVKSVSGSLESSASSEVSATPTAEESGGDGGTGAGGTQDGGGGCFISLANGM